jgi:hypothetical protein
MGHSVRFETVSPLSPADENLFTQSVRLVCASYASGGKAAGVPEIDVEVILTDDIAASIGRLRQGSKVDDPIFEIEESKAGRVSGKTLPRNHDWSVYTVLINRARWSGPPPPGSVTLLDDLALVAHEIAHAVFWRARSAAGGLNQVKGASLTAFTSWDEYRCNRFADNAVREIATHADLAEKENWNLWRMWYQGQPIGTVARDAHRSWKSLFKEPGASRDVAQAFFTTLRDLVYQLGAIQGAADGSSINLRSVLKTKDIQGVVYIYEGWDEYASFLLSQDLFPNVGKLAAQEIGIVSAAEKLERQLLEFHIRPTIRKRRQAGTPRKTT